MTRLIVNGQTYEVDNDPAEPLVWVFNDNENCRPMIFRIAGHAPPSN